MTFVPDNALPDNAMVRSRRLELPRDRSHNALNVARLPVPPRPHNHHNTPSTSHHAIQWTVSDCVPYPDAVQFMEDTIAAIQWTVSDCVPYPDAVQHMEDTIAAIHHGKAAETVWLLSHPHCYVSGKRTEDAHILNQSAAMPLYCSVRGGSVSWHGMGQRIAYIMVNLKKRGWHDIRQFVMALENCLIDTMGEWNITAQRNDRHHGVWVNGSMVASVGLAVRHGISWHGVAVNLTNDLTPYDAILPCGMKPHLVSSLAAQGHSITHDAWDAAFAHHCARWLQ